MQIANNHVILCLELKGLSFLSQALLENLTKHNGDVFGVGREGYYVLNTNRMINNFQQTEEVELFNKFLSASAMKGYSLILIKI